MTHASEQTTSAQDQVEGQEGRDQEPVWTYRGYRLEPGQFTTAMVHFFRAEISRANVWRQRLDTTTNWAVVTTGAAISFAFSERVGDHRVIILNTLLVTLFLYIEARRYRYYELWSSRVRLMETDFIAAMLVPPFRPASDWAESLAENLLHPQFPISAWEAFGRRLRRNYLWIYVILCLAWLLKLWLQPTSATSWSEFIARAAIGGVPGELVLLIVLGFNGLLLLTGLLTVGLQEATGEVLPRYEALSMFGINGGASPARPAPSRGRTAWFRSSRRRQQLMALIVTDRSQPVAARVLAEMDRGVTALSGTGMYTDHAHPVLLCALTVTEVEHLKAVVSTEDPKAFVVVLPAQDVLGKGFQPLEEFET
jgi:uncharacterized membrane protein